MPMLSVLGPVEVPGARLDRPQQRAVLAYLLLRAGEQVSSTQLIDAVWADHAPSSARTQIHSAISRLRRVLADSGVPVRILSKAGGYVCEAAPDAVDLAVFRTDLRQARQAVQNARPAEAAQLLDQGLDLWRGEALAGINAAFADAARALLHQERVDARELWARCQLDLDRADAVVPVLAEAAAAEPLRERLVALLMLALYRTGRQAQALELYQSTQRRLSEDLGVDPGAELAEAHMAILKAEPVGAGGRGDPGLPTAGGMSGVVVGTTGTGTSSDVSTSTSSDASTGVSALAAPGRWHTRIRLMAVVAVAVLSATVAAIITTGLVAHRPVTPELIAQPIHVFNIDGDCATQTQRLYICSMGLAKSPNAYHTTNDVVAHRVWHGDVLMADCMVTNGIRITDEKSTSSPDWYRIRLPDVPGGVAWLPAVRTHDHPVLPLCPTD